MSDSTYVALDSAFGALRLKQYDVAIECFEAGRRFSPWRTDILKNLAYAYLRIGDNDKARSRFAMTVSLDTADSHSALELAFLDFEERDPDSKARAHRLFARLRSAPDAGVRVSAAKAFDNIDRGLVDRIARLHGALAANSADYSLSRDLANALEERNLLAEAESSYRRLLVIDPSRSAAYLDIARVLRRAGRNADAEHALKTAAESSDPFVSEPAKDALARLRNGAR